MCHDCWCITAVSNSNLSKSSACSFYVGKSEEILGNGSSPILSVESKGHAFLVCINGELQGDVISHHIYLITYEIFVNA